MPEIRLKVPYFPQRDSEVQGQSWRMCYSSSNSMMTEFLKPGTLPGVNGDDIYLRRLMGHGWDSTDASAQIKTLKSFGIDAQFKQDLTWDDIDNQLDRGIPIPVGWLHHGSVSAPSGGGHWCIIIGKTADGQGYIFHDPWGEIDLVNGNYISTNGKSVVYSKKNFTPRWRVNGAGGWGIIAKDPRPKQKEPVKQETKQVTQQKPDNTKHWAYPLAKELQNTVGHDGKPILSNIDDLDQPYPKGQVIALFLNLAYNWDLVTELAKKLKEQSNDRPSHP